MPTSGQVSVCLQAGQVSVRLQAGQVSVRLQAGRSLYAYKRGRSLYVYKRGRSLYVYKRGRSRYAYKRGRSGVNIRSTDLYPTQTSSKSLLGRVLPDFVPREITSACEPERICVFLTFGFHSNQLLQRAAACFKAATSRRLGNHRHHDAWEFPSNFTSLTCRCVSPATLFATQWPADGDPVARSRSEELLCEEPLCEEPVCEEPLCEELLCEEPLCDKLLCEEPLCEESLREPFCEEPL
ncbi:hypothetical protein NDU88_007316 [Pleurodeles waltl]|uniref:Uncharacterized protein n=1 Tax=Pleurodeles waltl TaxID=8319 RepID=A0AAV7WD47_PLEWA|nr:hypothetical protein NDU88_007316 [Pleurodeles waltl]